VEINLTGHGPSFYDSPCRAGYLLPQFHVPEGGVASLLSTPSRHYDLGVKCLDGSLLLLIDSERGIQVAHVTSEVNKAARILCDCHRGTAVMHRIWSSYPVGSSIMKIGRGRLALKARRISSRRWCGRTCPGLQGWSSPHLSRLRSPEERGRIFKYVSPAQIRRERLYRPVGR